MCVNWSMAVFGTQIGGEVHSFLFLLLFTTRFSLSKAIFKDRTLRKCILSMFSPPPSHPLGDAFSDSFRNRKENFHRWCMKQLNHNRAWKRGFEFQKDYRSSDLKLISKLDLYATVFRGKTSERILKMWKLSVLMQIKNMKSTLNQLMNLLQVETVLQVLLLLYVSNKINLPQVHIFFFFLFATFLWASIA